MADYTANIGGGSADPTVDKDKLIARILETIDTTKTFLKERDFSLEALVGAKDFHKLALVQMGANAVSGGVEDKKTFSTYASELNRLVKYLNRDDIEDSVRQEYDAIAAIYAEMQKKRKTIDNTDLMVQINSIINEHIQIEEASEGLTPSRQFDISKIDFDLLRREFAKANRKNLVMKDLQELIQQKLDKLLFTNPNRMDYYERYQAIITDYNAEQNRATIEKTFMDLMDLASNLDSEQQRYVREGFESDEELSLYDMLFREDLSKNDIKKIKEVAATILQKVKAKIAELDHWTDKQETKDIVDTLIRDTLWAELPVCYDDDSVLHYRTRIYEYVYTRYKEVA